MDPTRRDGCILQAVREEGAAKEAAAKAGGAPINVKRYGSRNRPAKRERQPDDDDDEGGKSSNVISRNTHGGGPAVLVGCTDVPLAAVPLFLSLSLPLTWYLNDEKSIRSSGREIGGGQEEQPAGQQIDAIPSSPVRKTKRNSSRTEGKSPPVTQDRITT